MQSRSQESWQHKSKTTGLGEPPVGGDGVCVCVCTSICNCMYVLGLVVCGYRSVKWHIVCVVSECRVIPGTKEHHWVTWYVYISIKLVTPHRRCQVHSDACMPDEACEWQSIALNIKWPTGALNCPGNHSTFNWACLIFKRTRAMPPPHTHMHCACCVSLHSPLPCVLHCAARSER